MAAKVTPVLCLLKGSRVAQVTAAICVLAVSCAALAHAQTYPVKGTILNSITHEPIARALVDGHQDAVLTDNDGRFELNLPAGETQLSVRRPGYNSRERRTSMVNVAANMADVTLYLTPEALISGHVTLSTGDEADGIRIAAYRKHVVNGRERWTMQSMTTTNSEGAFRLANLDAPASYLIYSMPAHERLGPVAPGATSFGYPSVFYPGVADVAAAGVLNVSPGQQAQADFTLTRQPFYPVTIAVPGREGGRGVGIEIHDASGRVVEFGTRWDPIRQTAQINLPTGRYYAEGHFGGEGQTYGRVDFTVAGGPVSGLTMALVPLHAVPVEIHKDFTANNGSTPDVALVSNGQSESNPGLGMVLASVDAFGQQTGGGLRHSDGLSDGSAFELENVTPGRYWVQTTPYMGYVSSITSGGVDLAREPLVIGAGNATAPIQITLRNDGGQIQGQILTQNPGSETSQSTTTAGTGAIATTYIYAIPLFATPSSTPQAFAHGSTQFTLSNLAPGSYRVIALDEPTEIDPSDPQDLAKYTGKGQTVSVEAGGTASVQLEVISSAGEGPAL
jgi:hypothetical protein